MRDQPHVLSVILNFSHTFAYGSRRLSTPPYSSPSPGELYRTLQPAKHHFGSPFGVRDCLVFAGNYYKADSSFTCEFTRSSPSAMNRPLTMSYNSVTVGITLTGACATFMPVNQILRIRLTEPAFAFQSIMACRAHRRIVLGTSRFKANPDSPHSIAMTTVLPYFPNPEVPSNMELEREHETQVAPQVA